MINRYDPLEAPNPGDWLELDEGERRRLVQEYHRRARIRLPNARVHAVMHAIIENQIALGDDLPVQRAAQRLMDEGLDRHDAIHAIASVLIGYMSDLTRQPTTDADPNEAYFAAVEQLTAERLAAVWLNGPASRRTALSALARDDRLSPWQPVQIIRCPSASASSATVS